MKYKIIEKKPMIDAIWDLFIEEGEINDELKKKIAEKFNLNKDTVDSIIGAYYNGNFLNALS